MSNWSVSETVALYLDATVWDMTVLFATRNSRPLTQSMIDGGYTRVSLSLAADWHNLNQTIQMLNSGSNRSGAERAQ